MTLEADMQLQGIACEQAVSGYTFQVLTNGVKFPGRLDAQPSIDPRLNLSSDPREYATLSVLRSDVPIVMISPDALSQIRLSQQDSITGFEVGQWMVVNRNDNPADAVEATFWLTKVTPNDT